MNKHNALKDLFFRNEEGLMLHAVRGGTSTGLTPLVCLPGLTRSTRDFAPVFEIFGGTREIIAFDFRGRGKSERASDPASYTPQNECADTLSFLDHLNIERFAVLGTSRGGIVGMMIAALYADRLAGLLLNDIGCAIEADGLKRIVGYVGKPVTFSDWDQAANALAWSSVGFQNLDAAAWTKAAKMIFAHDGNRPYTDHDPNLSANMPSIEEIDEKGIDDLWEFVPLLQSVTLSLLRGDGSDLLSRATVERMKTELPHLKTTEVKDRGHVPFLDEPESVAAIRTWLADVDQKEKGQS